jgi:hypothetical protein
LKGDHLLGRNLRESLVEQVHAGGLLVGAESVAKVVHGPQLKFAVAQVLVAHGVAHLHIEGEGVVQLSIAPAEAGFERFQADQHIEGHIGPRGHVAIQFGKGALVEALEHFAPKGARPRLREPLALMGGQ